jgi:hypothetical protein
LRVDVVVLLAEAEVGQLQHRRGVVQDAHDDLLAPHRRQRRDAQVDLLAVGVDRQPAVLRDAALAMLMSAMIFSRLVTPAVMLRASA